MPIIFRKMESERCLEDHPISLWQTMSTVGWCGYNSWENECQRPIKKESSSSIRLKKCHALKAILFILQEQIITRGCLCGWHVPMFLMLARHPRQSFHIHHGVVVSSDHPSICLYDWVSIFFQDQIKLCCLSVKSDMTTLILPHCNHILSCRLDLLFLFLYTYDFVHTIASLKIPSRSSHKLIFILVEKLNFLMSARVLSESFFFSQRNIRSLYLEVQKFWFYYCCLGK